MDYFLLAQDLIEFMNKNKIPKTILIGHSMGGKTSVTASCMFSSRFTQLFILDVEPVNYMFRPESFTAI